jgi:hypothetical protein
LSPPPQKSSRPTLTPPPAAATAAANTTPTSTLTEVQRLRAERNKQEARARRDAKQREQQAQVLTDSTLPACVFTSALERPQHSRGTLCVGVHS